MGWGWEASSIHLSIGGLERMGDRRFVFGRHIKGKSKYVMEVESGGESGMTANIEGTGLKPN